MSNYAFQAAKLWDTVKIGRSKYRAIGRDLRGIMLWKGSGPTIYVMIEKAAGEWGLGRFEDKAFAHPIAQQFSYLSNKIRQHIRAQQRGEAPKNPRKNVFAFNNPLSTNEQREVYELVARLRNKVLSPATTPAHRHDVIRQITGALDSLRHIQPRKMYTHVASIWREVVGKTDAAPGRTAIVKGPVSNPAGESPAKLREVAASVGLHIGHWAPGDGVTRYRFFTKPSDYFSGDGIYTALGLKEAWCFLRGYVAKASPRTNPGGGSRKITREDIERAVRTLSKPGTASEIEQLVKAHVGHYFKGYAGELESFIVRSLNSMRGDDPLSGYYSIPWENPRGENQMEQAARAVGLYVTTWAPGDGVTRYRFFTKPSSYDEGSGLYTAKGRSEAMKFIQAYAVGRGAKGTQENPLARVEVAKATHVGRRYIDLSRRLKKHGNTHAASEAMGVAIGIGTAIGLFGKGEARRVGHRLIHRAADVELGLMPNPSRVAQEFISGKIQKLIREGYPSKQAQAIAYSMARRAGYKVNGARRNCCNNPAPHVHVWVEPTTARGGGYTIRISPAPTWTRSGQVGWYKRKADAEARADVYRKEFGTRKNPLLQTVMLANPPISQVWDTLTHRRRHAALEFAGFPDDYARLLARGEWTSLTDGAKRALAKAWQENPLTRKEAAEVMRHSRSDIRFSRTFVKGSPTRIFSSGQAVGRASTVRKHGPRSAKVRAGQIEAQAYRAYQNPAIRVPFREGQKIPIERARAWVRSLGNPELMKQFEDAERLQTKANRKPQFVIWKTLPIGSTKKIEMLTAFAHYGESPETMYKPPKGSRKGRSMFRHDWGDGSGRPRPVPVLAAPSGKAIIKVMGPGQKVGDWMRG